MKHFCRLFFFSLLFALRAGAALTIARLDCEHRKNPLGVDALQPCLGWVLQSAQRGERQTAYQILAASSRARLDQNQADLWDSGRVVSDATLQIPFAGQPLKSAQQIFWKVRVWDAAGKVSAWSAAAAWTMGLLEPADWRAHWIAAPLNASSVLLRREFPVKSGLLRATAFVCGLGQYEMSVNGKKAGENLLAPGWTQYKKTCLYDTLDLTAQLHRGPNAVGIILGNGMYRIAPDKVRYVKFTQSFGPLQAMAQIRLDYADGASEIIGTDASWQAGPSPITFNNIFAGEDFDARLEAKGWDQPGFAADARWTAARETAGPGGLLKGLSRAAPPILAIETLKPAGSKKLGANVIVYDLGQNASMMPKLIVSGPRGSCVRIIPAELLQPDGAVDRASCTQDGIRPAWWQYTLRGGGEESYFPKFFYQGCRYLQVELHPAQAGGPLPKIQSLAGVVVHSSAKPVGTFNCSNPLFNRIYQLVRWAQRSNMVSLMTDCPHRERLGWLEEDHLNGPALRYEFDLAQLFTKTLNDIADSQLSNGLVPTTAPEYTVFRTASDTNHLRNAFGDSPEWSSSLILVPWQQYEFDGDLNLFRLHYGAMKAYLDYLGSRAKHGIVNYGLGDWYDLGPKKPGVSQLTPIALTATAFYYEDAKIMSQAAGLLGQTADAQGYSALADKIRAAFNAEFYDATNQWYATDSQCANAMPLVMGLCEPENRGAVTEAIVRDVRARGNALTAGDVGYRYLLRALADGGHSEVIFDINDQTNKPGYGLQLAKGKTSLTEAWDGGSSQNHFMLGQIQEWFYHDLAGIQSGGNGFKQIIIAPQPAGDVSWVKAGFDSVRGKITCQWRRAAEKFTLKISIPANTTATVFVPSNPGTHVKNTRTGVQFLRYEKDRAVFAVGSGESEFQSVY